MGRVRDRPIREKRRLRARDPDRNHPAAVCVRENNALPGELAQAIRVAADCPGRLYPHRDRETSRQRVAQMHIRGIVRAGINIAEPKELKRSTARLRIGAEDMVRPPEASAKNIVVVGGRVLATKRAVIEVVMRDQRMLRACAQARQQTDGCDNDRLPNEE